jgi:hypothetical protein
MQSLSTPSGVVAEYFESLRWLAKSAEETNDEGSARRLAALATISAVSAVEVFLNLWFRSYVAEQEDVDLEMALVKDLKERMPLDEKLSDRPARHFGTGLDLSKGPGREFVLLKDLRNSIVHFDSAHQTIHPPGMIVHGLADTSKYDTLSVPDARPTLPWNRLTRACRPGGRLMSNANCLGTL